ncbi:MAG TPA: hypothetical protein VGM90_22475 [Kofleriaceae bacterium]|jgi:hypothetical protein
MKLLVALVCVASATAAAAPKGPHLVVGKRVSTGNATTILFTSTRLVFAEESSKTSALVDVDLATGTQKDLFRTKEQLVGYECDAAVTVCVLDLNTGPHGREMLSTGDVSRLVVLERTHTTPLSITGVPHPMLIDVSPDGRYVLVREELARNLIAYDRTTKTQVSLSATPTETLWVDSWSGSTVTVTHQPQANPTYPTYSAWNLTTDASTTPAAPRAQMPVMSPNNTRAAEIVIVPPAIRVTEAGKTRTRTLTEKEAEWLAYDCEWLDDRWLATGSGFLDTTTMTLAPLPKGTTGFDGSLEYVHGSRTVLYGNPKGTFIATLVGP